VTIADPAREAPLSDREASADTELSRQARRLPSIIGTTVVMKGELIIGEDLVIEGTFDGRISGKGADTVTIGRGARLSGELTASEVRIERGARLENTVVAGRIARSKR